MGLAPGSGLAPAHPLAQLVKDHFLLLLLLSGCQQLLQLPVVSMAVGAAKTSRQEMLYPQYPSNWTYWGGPSGGAPVGAHRGGSELRSLGCLDTVSEPTALPGRESVQAAGM